MKKFGTLKSICSVLGLLILCSTVLSEDYCLHLYRRDLCQTWSISSHSTLCNMQGEVPGPDQGSNELSIWVVAKDNIYIQTGYTQNSSLKDNYYSTYNGLGGAFGVALRRDRTSGGIILKFDPSTSSNATVRRDVMDGLGAHVMYIVNIPIQATSGGLNPTINLMFLIINFVAGIALMYFLKTAVLSVVWLTLYPIIVGFLQATIRLDNSFIFLIVCSLVNALAYYCGKSVTKLSNSRKIMAVVACFAIGVLFMVVGNPWGYGSGVFYMASCLLMAILTK